MKFYRKSISHMVPYKPLLGAEGVRLHLNEGAFNPLPLALDDIIEKFRGLRINQYPRTPQQIIKLISKYFSVREDNILLTHGSAEGIRNMIDAFLDPRDKIGVFQPDYGLYSLYAQIKGAKVFEFPLRLGRYPDIRRLIDFINRHKIKMFMFSRPHNPLGFTLSAADVKRLLDKTDCLLCVDEAYMEYSREESSSVFIRDHRNIAVLKSASKALGCAGLRIGFIFSNGDNLQEVRKVMAHEISLTNQIVFECVLKHYPQIRKQWLLSAERRDRLAVTLAKYPFVERVFDTDANFLLIKMKKSHSAHRISEYLKNKGIFVRTFPLKELQNVMRISMGSRAEQKKLLEALGAYRAS